MSALAEKPAFREFSVNWKAFLGGFVGLACGQSLTGYINSTFAPTLLTEFGWSRADLALTALTGMVAILCIPIAGRLTDLFGVRRVATIGIIAFPLTFIGFSMMNGSIYHYALFTFLQYVFCTTTTSTVYSRIVAERFFSARGIALSILASGPALSGAIASPVISTMIETDGWRFAYQALAGFFALTGILTLLLLPKGNISEEKPTHQPHLETETKAVAQHEKPVSPYKILMANRYFWFLVIATFLTTVPNVLANLHLKLMLVDTGLDTQTLSYMISLFAMGTLVGRLASGVALDIYPAYKVTLFCLGMPSIGMLIIASGTISPLLIGLGILIIGLAYGAEGDALAYLVVKHFGVKYYSTLLGLITATIALSNTISSVVLSYTLTQSQSYSTFLYLASGLVIIGSFMFLTFKTAPDADTEYQKA